MAYSRSEENDDGDKRADRKDEARVETIARRAGADGREQPGKDVASGRGDQRNGQENRDHKPPASAAGPVLGTKEVHTANQNETAGTSRLASDSISRNSASSNRNAPAIRLVGKLSQAVL